MKTAKKINTRIEIIKVLDNMKKTFDILGDKELAKEVTILTGKVMSENIKDFLEMEYVKEGERKL